MVKQLPFDRYDPRQMSFPGMFVDCGSTLINSQNHDDARPERQNTSQPLAMRSQ
jgi:hypothetical protein